jgi:hypothetical protein
MISGGAEEDRTPDLRIANATLSQLSYGPISRSKNPYDALGGFKIPRGFKRDYTGI